MGARAPQTASTAPTTEQKRKLKRGELLFSEGDNSRAMYFLRTGMLRIYKRKGDSYIEIDTIRAGQIVGELAFLDGNPRSASAEALTECELIEVGGAAFTTTLTHMPDWLKILLKTVVGRLRTAGTRIRQLEAASTSFNYGDSGSRESNYTFLPPSDVLKMCTATLLVGMRYGTLAGNGVELNTAMLNRYGTQILQVASAKVTALLDLLCQANILKADSTQGEVKYTLLDPVFLEKLIAYLNDENICEPSKRHDLTIKGFRLMNYIAKYLPECPKDAKTGLTQVNLAKIVKAETPAGGKEPFKFDELPELVRLGYATALNMKSADEAITEVDAEKFTLIHRFQRMAKLVDVLNEQKRKAGTK